MYSTEPKINYQFTKKKKKFVNLFENSREKRKNIHSDSKENKEEIHPIPIFLDITYYILLNNHC